MVSFKELPPIVKGQLKKRGIKGYTKAQIVKVAGAVLVALGNFDLPLSGQKEALRLVESWLKGMKE